MLEAGQRPIPRRPEMNLDPVESALIAVLVERPGRPMDRHVRPLGATRNLKADCG